MPLLGLLPRRVGKSHSTQPQWERAVLLEGKGDRQDDPGNKVDCSSEPGLRGFTVEEEALGYLSLGSGTCQPWTAVVSL